MTFWKFVGLAVLVLVLLASGLWIIALPIWLYSMYRRDKKEHPENYAMASPSPTYYDDGGALLVAGAVGYYVGSHHGHHGGNDVASHHDHGTASSYDDCEDY